MTFDPENEATDDEHEETVRAIRRGLDDMHAGRTSDAFEVAERLRQKIETIAERPVRPSDITPEG